MFVTSTFSSGKFFGQLEKRSLLELNSVLTELVEVYSNEPAPPLLYADVRSHLGDFAVIKWSADSNYYRVKINEEFAHDAMVNFIDYGNSVKVSRCEVLAPVNVLKNFTCPPFGITCQIEGVTITRYEWADLINDKSVHVKIGNCVGDVYQVTLTNLSCNKSINDILNAPKPAVKSPLPTRKEYLIPALRSKLFFSNK